MAERDDSDGTDEPSPRKRNALHETEHEDGSIAETVVEALAEASSATANEMTPLYESVNPDALDALFDRRFGADAPKRVEFRHDGFDIVVEHDGRVAVLDSV